MRALALAVLLLGQDSLDELLRGLGDDDPARRQASSGQILDRWEKWTEEELARLRKAAEGADTDLAGRAREIFDRITLRRDMGAELLAAEPDLEPTVIRGPLGQRKHLLYRIAKRARPGTPDERRARLLAERAVRERWFPDPAEILESVLQAGGLHTLAPLVASCLDHPRPEARKLAALSLGNQGAREYSAAIAALLADSDDSVVEGAVTSLNSLLALDQFSRIVPLLDRPGLREAATLALAQTAARPRAGEVRALLDRPDPLTRGAAATVLGGMGANEHASAVAALLKSDDPALLIRAAGALGRMGAQEQADPVAALLKFDDPFVRSTAAQALGRMRIPRFAPQLLALLRDPVTDVRDFAGAALDELLPADQVATVAALLVDRDAVVRGLSARALGQAGIRDRAKDITQVLDWEHPWSRGRALRALGGLGAVEHLDRVIELTRDEWDVVRIAAAAALCDLSRLPWPEGKKARAIEKLREARKDFGEAAPRAATAALVVLEEHNVAAEREVLETLDPERDTEALLVLLDALARLHEKKGIETLDREISIENAVDSMERLQEELRKAGLSLVETGQLRMSGRIAGKWRTTPRKLLAAIWEGTVAVPQGDRVRVLHPIFAHQHWLDQLRKR
jgi:HEAT repeat protein